MSIFTILTTIILIVSAFYIYQRLIPHTWSRLKRAIGLLGLLLLSMCLPAQFFIRLVTEVNSSYVLINILSYGFGFYSLLLVFTVAQHVISLPFRFIKPAKNVSNERRDFLRQSSRAGILGATTAVFGYAAHRALAEPTINRIQISIDNLPAELEGLTIGQISDVHVGQLQNEDTYLKKIVAAVNSLNVDIMAITGDVVDGSVARLKNSVAPLAQIQSKLGTFYVTGNHEYYSGAVGWIEHFKTFGWHVLGNEHATLNVRGHAIVVAGVHDLKAEQRIPAHACNPEKAFKNSPENAQLTLLLAHHPGTSELTKNLKVDLQLSGHTHAGQYFPATWLVQYFHRFSRGLNRNQNGWVYVNSGTGYWGPPLRTTDISGEITHITLMRA